MGVMNHDDDGDMFKIYALLAILVITLIAGLAPTQLRNVNSHLRDTILAYFSFFTGGVFLGAGLLHMLPDSNEAMHSAMPDQNFPIAFLASCCGFIVVWSIDKVNLTGYQTEKTVAHKRSIVAVAAGAADGGAVICNVTIPGKVSYRARKDGDRERAHSENEILSSHNHNHGEDDYKTFNGDTEPLIPSSLKHRAVGSDDLGPPSRGAVPSQGGEAVWPVRKSSPVTCYDGVSFTHSATTHSAEAGHDHAHSHAHTGQHSSHSHSHGGSDEHDDMLHDHEHEEGHHHHIVIPGDDAMLPFILAIVFSVHSFVAGLALGVQDGASAGAISILVAILSHKVVEAITVGTNFIKEKVDISRAIPVILVYCFMTPAGILVGMYLTNLVAGNSSIEVQALAQAFASGSFIYLAMHEISDPKCCNNVSGLAQVSLLLLGTGVMAWLAVYV